LDFSSIFPLLKIERIVRGTGHAKVVIASRQLSHFAKIAPRTVPSIRGLADGHVGLIAVRGIFHESAEIWRPTLSRASSFHGAVRGRG
jgi:hypothetical protein